MKSVKRVFLTGGRGMLGQALQRCAAQHKDKIDWEWICPSSDKLDLRNRAQVDAFFAAQAPFDLVIHGAAKVGGIKANIADPSGFLFDNMQMNFNVIDASFRAGVRDLVYLGSSCMYPRDYQNPLREDYILAAPLEPTNEGYALAKISGFKLCQALSAQYGVHYRTLVPCNLYGRGDHFNPQSSHLLAAIILKTHQAIQDNARSIEIWGDGSARREFLYVDDLADFIMREAGSISNWPDIMNVGAGIDHSILEYYQAAASIMGYSGDFSFNLDAPVGMKYKLMTSERARTLHQWTSPTGLQEGISKTYEWFLEVQKPIKGAA